MRRPHVMKYFDISGTRCRTQERKENEGKINSRKANSAKNGAAYWQAAAHSCKREECRFPEPTKRTRQDRPERGLFRRPAWTFWRRAPFPSKENPWRPGTPGSCEGDGPGRHGISRLPEGDGLPGDANPIRQLALRGTGGFPQGGDAAAQGVAQPWHRQPLSKKRPVPSGTGFRLFRQTAEVGAAVRFMGVNIGPAQVRRRQIQVIFCLK